jgi:hypothetical protein
MDCVRGASTPRHGLTDWEARRKGEEERKEEKGREERRENKRKLDERCVPETREKALSCQSVNFSFSCQLFNSIDPWCTSGQPRRNERAMMLSPEPAGASGRA